MGTKETGTGKKLCMGCAYWDAFNVGMRGDRGDCRRYAPRPGVHGDITVAVWVDTLRDDWCGEFEWREPVR